MNGIRRLTISLFGNSWAPTGDFCQCRELWLERGGWMTTALFGLVYPPGLGIRLKGKTAQDGLCDPDQSAARLVATSHVCTQRSSMWSDPQHSGCMMCRCIRACQAFSRHPPGPRAPVASFSFPHRSSPTARIDPSFSLLSADASMSFSARSTV